MVQQRDIGRSTAAFVPEETLVVVVEMSRSAWLVAGLLPGIDRRPLKKLEADENNLMRLLESWRQEALAAGRTIGRIVVAYEAGRDGFWLARWLTGPRYRSPCDPRNQCHCVP